MASTVIKKILGKLSKLGGNTLYYPGCLTKFAGKSIEKNYKTILEKLEIEYITLPKTVCCGSPILSAGYKEDYEKLVQMNKEMFDEYSIKRIITNCPTCYKMFTQDYALENIKVEHITQTLAKNLDKLQANTHKKQRISYHDPCHLGRHSGVYDEPRKVLEHLGFKIIEMKRSHEEALCCGGGGGVKSNYPDLALRIAKERLKQCTENRIITPCTLCYKQFKEAAKGTGIQVQEFSEVLI